MRKLILSIIVIVIFIHIAAGQYILFAADGNAKSTCYCCKKNGTVQLTSKSDCKKDGGKCFDSQVDATVYCATLQAKCWCCMDGSMKHVFEQECKKRNLPCYKTEEEAKKHEIDCVQRIITVICCVNNKIEMLTEKKCKAKNGKIYPNMDEAKKECKTTSGHLVRHFPTYYCCNNGKIIETKNPSHEQECYENSVEAIKECFNGWCCEKGKVYEAKVSDCRQIGGLFFDEKTDATKACKPYWESNCYCCIDKKIYLHPPIVCKEKNGKCYYGNEIEAKIKCSSGGE